MLSENLAGKTILEVGSGRGETTRTLAGLLAGFPGTRLVVTDISDKLFPVLQNELAPLPLEIEFTCTDAVELRNIPAETVDYIVCNYTLCAVNARVGRAELALRRFWAVLKSGGKLLVEEEFPITVYKTPAQEIWAEKWRILKAAIILAGGLPYNEIAPEVLADLCRLACFENIAWEARTSRFEPDSLEFFQRRLVMLLEKLPNAEMEQGFSHMADNLRKKAVQSGGMEVPYYWLTAQKH